ncbi:MAG: hypothetical protein A2Z16_10500 [Chloroflexi bacterium RBG_16_54_18]|nr:MAG: hypothetical protein A2Z16_10500 [Chloroflexi bacterium RBG_16_54_18]
MESVEVIARFNEQCQIDPLSFKREGRNYHVDAIGRRWEDDSGQHFLVMVPLERVFELLYVKSESRWYLKRVGMDRFSG